MDERAAAAAREDEHSPSATDDVKSSAEEQMPTAEQEQGNGTAAAARDRLTELAEPLLLEILDHLDTKSAVQTTVLSRSYRDVWKHVRVLEFCNNAFDKYSDFERFVEWVLSVRDTDHERLAVHSATYTVDRLNMTNENVGIYAEMRHFAQFVRFINYAVSRGARYIGFVQCIGPEHLYPLSKLFAALPQQGECRVQSLDLTGVHVDAGFETFVFPDLIALDVDSSLIYSDDGGGGGGEDGDIFDPFSGIPGLKELVLTDCTGFGMEPDDYYYYESSSDSSDESLPSDDEGEVDAKKRLKISGAELLSLRMEAVKVGRVEIDAPNLTFFSIEQEWANLKFSRLALPSLDHAVVCMMDDLNYVEGHEETVGQRAVTLFEGLRNATALTLDSATVEDLSTISDFLEQQPFRFTGLQTLMVKGNDIPDRLVTYFFGQNEPNVEFLI